MSLSLSMFIYCKFHKTNQHRGGSYIESPDWIKHKNVTINPTNKKDKKCFQHAVKLVINYEEIKKDLQRTTKIKYFINKCI